MYFFASLKHVTEWRLGQNVPSSGGGLPDSEKLVSLETITAIPKKILQIPLMKKDTLQSQHVPLFPQKLTDFDRKMAFHYEISFCGRGHLVLALP